MPALCERAGMDFSKIRGKLAENQPFVRGLAPTSKKNWEFWWECCMKGRFEKLAWEGPALYGEPAPGVRIHMTSGNGANFWPIRGREIVSDWQTDRESTYCQTLPYEQCLQKFRVKIMPGPKKNSDQKNLGPKKGFVINAFGSEKIVP